MTSNVRANQRLPNTLSPGVETELKTSKWTINLVNSFADAEVAESTAFSSSVCNLSKKVGQGQDGLRSRDSTACSDSDSDSAIRKETRQKLVSRFSQVVFRSKKRPLSLKIKKKKKLSHLQWWCLGGECPERRAPCWCGSDSRGWRTWQPDSPPDPSWPRRPEPKRRYSRVRSRRKRRQSGFLRKTKNKWRWRPLPETMKRPYWRMKAIGLTPKEGTALPALSWVTGCRSYRVVDKPKALSCGLFQLRMPAISSFSLLFKSGSGAGKSGGSLVRYFKHEFPLNGILFRTKHIVLLIKILYEKQACKISNWGDIKVSSRYKSRLCATNHYWILGYDARLLSNLRLMICSNFM